ncbi:MAG TPA: hypothetical protein PLG94_15710, partial [Smithellaceae bacterium]|nr:hypothetical protein [Smithellaceae bacterium]
RWSGGRKPETNNTGNPLFKKVQNSDQHGIGGGFLFTPLNNFPPFPSINLEKAVKRDMNPSAKLSISVCRKV